MNEFTRLKALCQSFLRDEYKPSKRAETLETMYKMRAYLNQYFTEHPYTPPSIIVPTLVPPPTLGVNAGENVGIKDEMK